MSLFILNTKNPFTLTGAGTGFTFTFPIVAETELRVIYANTLGVETVLLLNTDYTVNLGPWLSGGTITTTQNYADGKLLIKRQRPKTQGLLYTKAGVFPSESHEAGLDKSVMLNQEVDEILSRVPTLSETTALTGITLADPTGQAGKLAQVNAAGNGFDYVNNSGEKGDPGIQGPAGGPMVTLNTQTASNVLQLDFTTNISATYRAIIYDLYGIIPVTDGVNLQMLTDSAGGASYDVGASDYQYLLSGLDTALNVLDAGDAANNAIVLNPIGISNTANWGFTGRVVMTAHDTTAITRVAISGDFIDTGTTVLVTTKGAGVRNSAATVNAVRFNFSGGNISSGIIVQRGLLA